MDYGRTALISLARRTLREGSTKVSGARPLAGHYADRGRGESGMRVSGLKRVCNRAVLTCSVTGSGRLKAAPAASPTVALRWCALGAEGRRLTTNCGGSHFLR